MTAGSPESDLDGHAKIAIATIATGMDPAQARAALETVGGVLGEVIDH
jgi:N-acetylmuramic acid 6-phosphate (MurNAc-6-P) etherase